MCCYCCRYTQVCLLHVFLHMQIHTEAYFSYACLELNACQCSANKKYPQQQGKHTNEVELEFTSISHTHKKTKPQTQEVA